LRLLRKHEAPRVMSESSDGPPAGERIGLRVSEACDLRWDDIDLGRRTIIVRRLKGSTDSSHYLERDSWPV
jgi:integrase